jgi:cytochrome P450
MQKLEERDYFTDYEILKEPYAFFEAVREHGPVYAIPGRDYLVVTGFKEAVEILNNHQDFSAIIGVAGAAAKLPFEPQGSDISEQVEAHRLEFLGGDQLVNLDDLPHTHARSLLTSLFTPSRLKANEEFIAAYSDQMIRKVVAKGQTEMIKEIATPFVTMVIADLLGVPQADRQFFMDVIAAAPPPGSLDESQNNFDDPNHPMVVMGTHFYGYVTDRRENPRDDILSELSNAKFPDGTTPDAIDIVKMAVFLFGAGQDTSAKLLGNCLRHVVDTPGLQDRIRQDPTLIPQFVEEVLRLEGSTKQTARLARRDTKIGDRDVPAGTKILLALSAANRDPERWEDPQALILDRPRIKEHVAFGRGKHVCAGAPLARVEVRVLLEKLFEYTSNIDFDAEKHGPPGNRNFEYEPSFIIRGLEELHLKLTPSEAFHAAQRNAPLQEAAPVAEPEAQPADAPRFSVAETKLGVLLKDDATRALLDKHFPGLTADKRIGLGKGMTLKAMQKLSGGMLKDEPMAALDADLAKL